MWTLILDRPRTGPENMAIDSALLARAERSGERFLRLYQWDPHCLSFGRHEPALKRYDVARIRREGIPCVRRPTGGRGVWHARELTYSVTAPLEAFGGMRQAYAAIHALLAASLRALGAKPLLAPTGGRPLALRSGPCFAAPVGGEVLLEGRKVVGSAQLRAGSALLQHGSLLLEDDQHRVRELAGLTGAAAVEVPLARALGRPIGFEAAAAAVFEAAGQVLDDAAPPADLPLAIATEAVALTDRFRSDAWTWMR